MPHKFITGPEVATAKDFDELLTIVNKNDEAVVAAIEKVNDKVNTVTSGLNDAINKIAGQIGEIDKKITGVDFAKVQSINFNDLKESLADRAEYKELWKAQLQEAKALETLRANQGDPEIQAMLSMKGLEVMVSRSEIAKLQGSKDQLKAALKAFPDSRGGRYARMLANLGYSYVLMAQHYKVAREHVTAVIAEKTVADILLSATIEILKAAVQAGLSALTAGVSGIVMDKWLTATNLAPDSSDYKLTDTDGNTKTVTINTKVEDSDQGKEIGRSMGAGVVSAPLETGRDQVLGALGSVTGQIGGLGGLVARATQLFSTDTPENTTQDPYDFFIDKEAQLRRAAAFLASCTDPKILSEIKVQLDREYSIDELENDPNWKPFFEIHESYDDLNAIWEQVSALLAANMRRLCWRLFCRSQWNNVKYSYTITVLYPSSKEVQAMGIEDQPASEWNYKVWNWSGLGWPRHWEKICSDFKGPEHDPNHKFTVTKGLVNRAHKLLGDYAWISLAAVECCQVKRYDARGISQNWAIDLEKYSHVGGEEDGDGGPLEVPYGWTDWDLVFGDIEDKKYLDVGDLSISHLENFLQKIRVHSGMRVQISELRFGAGGEDPGRWLKATGKKGRLSEANSPDAAIPVVKGMKITTLIKRTDAHGNATTSTKDAIVHLYKADKKKHDDNKRCDLVDKDQLCWYCAFCSDEDVASEGYKEHYKLKRVDQGKQMSVIISNSEVAFVNFPTIKSATYINEPGLYCIRLDPRRELQTMSNGQYHLTDEWWFRILDKANEQQAPNPPEIAGPLARGAKEVSGTYARRATDASTTTLIHVFVNSKMYGPKEVPHPGDTNPVTWKVEGLDELRGGEKVYATATWPASETEGARQSDNPSKAVLVEAEAPRLNAQRLYAGATWASGFSSAAPGSTIRLYVGDPLPTTIDGSTVSAGQTKLVGKIEDVAEVKEGGNVIVPEMKGVIRWQISAIDALPEGKKVIAKVFAYGNGASKTSDPKTVQLAPKPVATEPKPGDTLINGTAENVGALHIRLQVDGKQIGYNDIDGPPNDAGAQSWALGKVQALTPFKPGQKVSVQAGLYQGTTEKTRRWIPCSQESDAITIKKLAAKPGVDEVTPGADITGTVNIPKSLVADSEVWVKKQGGDWIAAATIDSPDGGDMTWTLKNAPVLKPGTDKIQAQVFGKAVDKKTEQVEFSELSDPADVVHAEKPVVNKPAANAKLVSGKFKYQPNYRILVKIGGKEMQHPAEFASKNAQPDDELEWKLVKIKAKGAKSGDRVELKAGTKVQAAIYIDTELVSEWGEETV